jgi:hypothetical protein
VESTHGDFNRPAYLMLALDFGKVHCMSLIGTAVK